MLFNSLVFLYVFLPLTYGVFWRLTTRDQRYAWLAASGYVFYGWWDYRFCALMAFSTLVSFTAGLGFRRWADPRVRRWLLIVPVTVDLALLGYFKYSNLMLSSVDQLAAWAGHPLHLGLLNVVLPVGISFYTFHTITYIVDCWRGTITPTANPLEFACYVSLFSQLVAGPIVRFREIEADLERIDAADRERGLDVGFSYFCIGLAKKVLVADTLAALVDPALSSGAAFGGPVEAWAVALGYTFQLYFDFSGYSDMAIGLGHLFGLRIPRNFDSPYRATDPSDFWRRWHISLSSCLRDYLYIPLGGSRGSSFATHRNLMVTMLLGGLWHGASWTFLAWGGYHGALLCLHRAHAARWDALPRALRVAATFLAVVVGWVLFRAETFARAAAWLGALVTPRAGPGLPGLDTLLGLSAALAAFCWVAPNSHEVDHAWTPLARAGWACAFVAALLVISAGRESPFLYFQF